MPYELSAVIMARNSETLVFESVYASPERCCGKEEQDLVRDGSDDAL
jgi:hypothetical protein